MFAAIRTDLPGDQRQKVAELLAHFPGFADQSTLEQSIGETLDKLIRAGTNGKHDYTTEIKPWLGGEVGLAITRAPDSNNPQSGGGLVVVQAKDTAKAEAWLRGTTSAKAQADETYDGVTVHKFTAEAAASGSSSTETMAEAVSGQLLLFGDVASVKAGLDAKQSGGLDSVDQYKTAARSSTADHLAWVYVDVKGFTQYAMQAAAKADPSASAAIPAGLADKLPAWVWLTVRAESNALVLDGTSPRVSGGTSTTDRVSTLAPKLPGSTVAVLEAHDLGSTLKSALNELSAQPATKDSANQVRQALAILGGVDRLLGWLGDSAVVVTRDGSSVGGGLVIHATDAKAAADAVAQIKNLLVVGLSSTGLTVKDETYNGATISTIDLTDLAQMAMGQATTTPSLPAGTRIQLAFAVRDDIAVIGAGDAFVKAVLDTKAGSSLADSATYKAALDAAGASNVGQAYIDLGTIVQSVVPLLPADAQARFAADIKPYVQPLQAVAFVNRGGDPSLTRWVVTVK